MRISGDCMTQYAGHKCPKCSVVRPTCLYQYTNLWPDEARRDFKLYKNLQLLLFSPIQFASFILTMNLLETKVVTLVILAVVSFLIGLSTIPLRFELRKVEQQTKDLWT